MKFFVIIKNNSERIKNKNFTKIGNLELWEHLILKLKDYDVFIDTDSEKILNATKLLNWCNTYKRLDSHISFENYNPENISPVLLMIERFLNNHVIDEDEIIVTPHVTSPFIKVETILDACKHMNKYESVQAATRHKEFGYYKNMPINFSHEVVSKTQDLEPIFLGNGAFFIFTKRSFFKYKNRTAKNFYLYPLTFEESVEIDYPEDLELVKKIYKWK